MRQSDRSPSLFSRPAPGERKTVAQDIDRLAGEVLPRRANATNRYPLHHDHCFKRVAFDLATGGQWDETIERPFYQNASLPQLRSARALLEVMAESPAATRALNAKSLSFRA
jgi:hypothetical protein